MRVIASFGSSVEDIARYGCSQLAAMVAKTLFKSKVEEAVKAVASAKNRLSELEAELAIQKLPRRGFSWELSEREVEDLELRVELAEGQVNVAMGQHDAVLTAKNRCYWEIAIGSMY